jgi:hypothetical protein
MSLDSLTRDQMLRYLGHEIDLAEFRGWLRPVLWQLGGDTRSRKQNPVTRRVGRWVAEFNMKHRTEWELRELFAGEVATAYVEDAAAAFQVYLDTAAETIEAETPAARRSQSVEGFDSKASQHPQTKHRTTKAPPDLLRTG